MTSPALENACGSGSAELAYSQPPISFAYNPSICAHCGATSPVNVSGMRFMVMPLNHLQQNVACMVTLVCYLQKQGLWQMPDPLRVSCLLKRLEDCAAQDFTASHSCYGFNAMMMVLQTA